MSETNHPPPYGTTANGTTGVQPRRTSRA